MPTTRECRFANSVSGFMVQPSSVWSSAQPRGMSPSNSKVAVDHREVEFLENEFPLASSRLERRDRTHWVLRPLSLRK